MEPDFEPNNSNEQRLLIEQQILQERSRRIMSDPNTIVLEPEASIEEHKEAIAKLINNRPDDR